MNVSFSRNYFKQNKVVHPNTKNVVNIYIVYNLDQIGYGRNTDFTIQNALFGAMKITEDATISDHNKNAGYGICFDDGSSFSFENIVNGKNVIIFGVDISFSSHSRNKQNNIYVLGKDFIQGVTTVGPTSGGTTIYAEKVYKANFTQQNKKFVLSLHYNGNDSFLFANGVQELKLKAVANQTQKSQLCVGNVISNWTVTNSEKTGQYGKIYGFVVDYVPISGVKKIYDIHRYLMTKHSI